MFVASCGLIQSLIILVINQYRVSNRSYEYRLHVKLNSTQSFYHYEMIVSTTEAKVWRKGLLIMISRATLLGGGGGGWGHSWAWGYIDTAKSYTRMIAYTTINKNSKHATKNDLITLHGTFIIVHLSHFDPFQVF